MNFIFILSVIFIICTPIINGRNHDIQIKNDKRGSILLSHFGYYHNGYLLINIDELKLPAYNNNSYGFTLDRSTSSGIASVAESGSSLCFLHDLNVKNKDSLVFQFHPNNTLSIRYQGKSTTGLLIYTELQYIASVIKSMSDISSSMTNHETMEKYPTKFNVSSPKALNKFLVDKLRDHLMGSKADDLANVVVTKLRSGRPLMLTLHQSSAISRLVQIEKSQYNQTDEINTQSDLSVLLDALKFEMNISRMVIDNIMKVPVNMKMKPLPLHILITFPTAKEEGDYDLYFHNCPTTLSASARYSPRSVRVERQPVDIHMHLVEKNWNSYLSAGDQPLALLFFIFCFVYIVVVCVWTIVICTSKHMVYKIHYLMLVLLIMKALTLFFHGINNYELGKYGVQEQGWAIMYYITHLLKGALLFTTIILIGAGWAFIKHVLSSKEKKIFAIIIPLQILANVAAIILEESEESSSRYLTWRNIFLLVDLICCGAILFPVIWSIKHLKDAANIDGKQAMNLQKLKLFRHFYILIICYIYMSRIIVYLLAVTVPFNLLWFVDIFRELTTLFFMLITGYKFRPVSNNPYLLVPDDEDDSNETELDRMEHAWGQSGVRDGVVKVTHNEGVVSNIIDSADEEEDDEEDGESGGVVIHFDKNMKVDTSAGQDVDRLIHTSRL